MNFLDIVCKTESITPMQNNLHKKIIQDPYSTDELATTIFQEKKGQGG